MLISDALVEMVGGDGKSNAGGTHYYNPGSEIELACVVRNRYAVKNSIVFYHVNFGFICPKLKKNLTCNSSCLGSHISGWDISVADNISQICCKILPPFYWLKLILGQFISYFKSS